MLRGGSWNNNARNCRSANRNRNMPDNRNNNMGFRVASTAGGASREGPNLPVHGPAGSASVQSKARDPCRGTEPRPKETVAVRGW
ncbi:MAG: hypothetical protein K1X74_17290 [Pirellulales bacterium]|nr:hypothetical protein [Pirellulales bacterium]